MMTDFPATRDVVLIGGGHTHALVLKKWGMQPLPGARLTVIDPAPRAAYSGMLPGFVAGHYARDDLDIDLVQLARFAGARLILGAVSGIDLTAREIRVPGRPPVAYDIAAINVGITSDMPLVPGFSEYAVPAKPLTPFAAKWEAYLTGDSGSKSVAIIGGGVAGCELAMAMAHALRHADLPYAVTLVDRSAILTEATPSGRDKLRRAMVDLDVTIRENAPLREVQAQCLVLDNGDRIDADFIVGAAGAKAHEWQKHIGLDTENGFICVDPMLRSSDHSVYATGDCAHMTHAPRSKAGVFAVRQAPVLFDNLVATLSGGTQRAYHPQQDYLKLISLGGKVALAEKWGRSLSGSALWRRKDQIDQKFMSQFRDLPVMAHPTLPLTHAEGLPEAVGDKPMCGGCGAKIGQGALKRALHAMPQIHRPDVVSVIGDDAAVLRMGSVRQTISTDHLRAVTDDPVLMTRIAAVHALGDIWAMGAQPQAATATIILPKMSVALQERTLAEVMSTASDVMGAAGAAIVGGHSSMGAEMTIGFTATGLTETDPITLSGARQGDVLILTKPLGSGVILSAEMQSRAPGDVVAACFAHMVREQGAASQILSGARSMTDVTGFGLAGHLAAICTASGVGARVEIADVPLMQGALDLSHGGAASTLLSDNRASVDPVSCPATPLGDLMFDPQTAGGLLACVPADECDACLARLRDAGYPAARIGVITAADDGVRIE